MEFTTFCDQKRWWLLHKSCKYHEINMKINIKTLENMTKHTRGKPGAGMYMYTYMDMYLYIYKYFLCICICIRIWICICIYIYILCICICIRIWICICTCICIWLYVYIYIYHMHVADSQMGGESTQVFPKSIRVLDSGARPGSQAWQWTIQMLAM